MHDLDLLRLVLSKDNYLRFKDVVKKHNVSSVTKDIFDTIGDYWDNYPTHTVVDLNTLRTFFFIVKGTKMKESGTYELAFNNLGLSPSDPTIVDALLKRLVEVDYATRIYNEVLGIATGRAGKPLSDLRTLLDEYDKEVGVVAASAASLFVQPSLSYLSSVAVSGGLSWRLPELNVSLGPIRKGDFIIIAARPETGKTTMVASEASYMLSQLKDDEHVIWINNEESSNKVMMRVIQAFNGCTTADLISDPTTYESRFLASGGHRFLVLDDDAPIKSAHAMEQLFEKHKPGLIVFDQLDKVNGFSKEDRDDLRIGKLYEWARRVAKKYCPVIAISQVDGSGEGEKWIQMNQLRGSKTDKVGEADAIVTIGRADTASLARYIHVPKNKLIGGTASLEAHRHGSFEVAIDPIHARYVSKWKL